MKTLLLTFLLLTAALGFLQGASNPFDRASDDLYTGRFVGKDVSLRLKPDAGKWSGELVFKGDTYTAQGEPRDGRLKGQFSDGSGDYEFTLQGEGDKFTFTANTFTSTLERQKPPQLKGVYQSKRVKLDFKNQGGGYNGTIEFQGKQYEFSAKDVAGTLEGLFKSVEASFPFTLRMDEDSLLFKTGTFEEVISLTERRDKERAEGLRAKIAKINAELEEIEGVFWTNLRLLTKDLRTRNTSMFVTEDHSYTYIISEAQGKRSLTTKDDITQIRTQTSSKSTKLTGTESIGEIQFWNIEKVDLAWASQKVIDAEKASARRLWFKLKDAVARKLNGDFEQEDPWTSKAEIYYIITDETIKAENKVRASIPDYLQKSKELSEAEMQLREIQTKTSSHQQ